MSAAITSARPFSEEHGHDPGIEAYGLQPVAEDAWRNQTLDKRLPDLMRAQALMVDLRVGGRRQEAS